ncbi:BIFUNCTIONAL LYCOPENE CYCLASE/PHYTOENE SYNTHASE [Salix purpurea]|uniref:BIFUNCTIONAL LYCOPENE CYCLASE/PHYTOENE SYNTHASE n=1 Tax=Salix purpurea TaxID=77065 RepID=A0A9Q0TKU3_SALPP|nr:BIFUNCTIONAL LYCOPENE CYCLASE/PHYTOENE SYNTHASE [Salix purpurea]
MFFFRSYFYLSNLLSSLGKAWLDPNGFSELSRHLTCPASIETMQRWSQVSAYTGASHHWTFILVDGSSPDVEMIKRKRCIELVWSSLLEYQKLLDAIDDNAYDNFTKRAYVGRAKKLLPLPLAYTKAQSMSSFDPSVNQDFVRSPKTGEL